MRRSTFASVPETPATLSARLKSTLEKEYPRLIAISDESASLPRAPGKWSAKEVIGHLVDSASNNHGRFVRAQLGDDLSFDGYEQDEWVAVQKYRAREWADLVEVWRAMNLHIAASIGAISEESLSRLRSRHNLDRIAWRAVAADQSVTLGYFVADYIDHLEHHLSQIS